LPQAEAVKSATSAVATAALTFNIPCRTTTQSNYTGDPRPVPERAVDEELERSSFAV